jgi:hypothetical protein
MYNVVALQLEVYVALLKLVSVDKTVSYINDEDCVSKEKNGEECRIGNPGY